jgi:transglutaminase-like putative cysteine protease
VGVRALTLVSVLIAVAAVGAQEDFRGAAALAGAAIVGGYVVSHLLRRRRRLLLKAAITALILVVARDFFATLLANPYDPRIPLVRLFLWLQVLHSFDLPARKDLKYSMASAVVLMAVAAVYARDAAFGLFLLPFGIAAGAAMAALGAPGPLTWRPALRAGAALAAGAIVVAVIVFAAVPRGQGLRLRWLPVSARLPLVARLQERIVNPAYPQDGQDGDAGREAPAFNPEGYIGFSTYVDLRLRGALTDDVVMRVRATRPAFWRGLAFDEYTGVGWRMADPAVEAFESDQPRIVPRFSADEPWPAGSEQVIQTFYIERTQPNVFFAAYRPFEAYVPTASLGVDRYAGLRSPVVLEPGTIYSVISRVPMPGPRALRRTTPAVPDAIRARYLALPPLPRRVIELARAITAGTPTPYDSALAVQRYLARYAYTLQAPPLPPGRDAVDHFLFESRQGSCEAFASAMAVLLRAAGVPARLVTGYTSGTPNVFTGYFEVRNSDAHAWVEVYIPGAGWIEFEPTPGFLAPSELTAPAGQWLLRDGFLWLRRWSAARGRSVGSAPPVVALLATVVVAAFLYAHTLRRRKRGRVFLPSRDPVERTYAALLRDLARRGYRRHPAQTPRDFLDTLPPHLRPPARTVTELFEACRYGGRIAGAAEVRACRLAAGELRSLARHRGRPGVAQEDQAAPSPAEGS